MMISEPSSRQEKTRLEFVDALHALLKQKPFEQISVNDICEQSQNHRSTFYRYYHDKYDLLQDEFRIMRQEVDSRELETNHRELITEVVDYVNENRREFRNLTTANQHENMHFVLSEALEQTLTEKLDDARTKDGSPHDQLLNQINASPRTDLVISMIAGAVTNLIMRWVTTEQSTSRDEIVTFLMDSIDRFCGIEPE
ncbi:TetR/AcrR family transcriptional regulator [Furfurilactobacillus siliginis]|uniref:TetR family transcriptional regulator n=1 Tax=Furfurilactobacillus siliginis TaxID=348151 RepID=A0A0R2L6H8_9LACO|nr:TetR/AcrR family transcriptional regulator C-terminal domain-containing protein [Furfurilactobacillus siliginis]KRN97323.1 hypothetical protein IV55_GL000251 [Furfurilactobacillus siliginis]GEK29176.1 TetR family transcriptional regulator [Furfurilactobacillus siliginis]